MIAAIGTGESAILVAGITATAGVLAAVITGIFSLIKDNRASQWALINRLLDREEKILTPLVGHAENVQVSLKTIGDGVGDLLVAQRIEDGSRRREGGD